MPRTQEDNHEENGQTPSLVRAIRSGVSGKGSDVIICNWWTEGSDLWVRFIIFMAD
jgi:hypothetical protein